MKKITLHGFVSVLKLFVNHLGSCIYLFAYLVIVGMVSVLMWLCKHAKRLTNTYPKTILLIVCIIFALDHVFLVVSHRANIEKQNIRFDSLAAMKDSIQRISSFDSGYAKGLIDGNSMLLYTDGLEQEKSIIHRP